MAPEITTEKPPVTTELDTTRPADETELDTEVASLAVDDGKGNKLVPLSALIGAKKDVRALKTRVGELESGVEKAKEVEARLNQVQPMIDALVTDPRLRAEAIRIAKGTRTSDGRTDQPTGDEDPHASGLAEQFGFYLADGTTPDIARGRRVLDIFAKQTDERIRPFAALTLNQRAEGNLERAAQLTDKDGVPLATVESIREVAKELPAQLLADPTVLELVVDRAAGIDRRKGRSPKPPEDPLFLERAGGGGRRPDPITADDRRIMSKVGLTDKDMTDTLKRLESPLRSGGIRLE